MVKLTVIYTLPAGADHDEFVRWRTTEHRRDNMAMPGVVKSDFYIIKRGWPEAETGYRYMTEAYFPDMATFERAFFDAGFQADLAEWLKRLANPLYLISEEVVSDRELRQSRTRILAASLERVIAFEVQSAP